MTSLNDLSIMRVQAHFESINFNSIQVIFDPLISKLFLPFKCCLRRRFCYKREKVLNRCQEAYENELEITNLLRKVRDTHAMVANLQTRRDRELLKFSKDRVINIDSSSSSASSDQSSSSGEDTLVNYTGKDH